jgi:hypothetical protein
MIDYHLKGMRYRDALQLISGARFPGGLSPWDDGSDVGPLIDRLVNGDWHATGRRVNGQGKEPSEPDVIRADWWGYLKNNPEKHAAAGGGVEFVDVRFHTGAPPEAKRPRLLRGDTAAAYAEHVAETKRQQGRKPSRSEDEAWAKSQGISRTRVRDLRSETLTPEEKKGGTPIRKLGGK